MKKFLVVCAVMMLPCFLVRAQEAEDAGRGAVLSFIPRFDAGVMYYKDAKEASFSFGNTSFYTLFEGNISDNWSFSVMNHWLSAAYDCDNFKEAVWEYTKDSYKFDWPFRGRDYSGWNFLDWAYITFSPGPFEFSLGKQLVLMGGFEYEDYDYDVNPIIASSLWNSVPCYRWAFTPAWNLPDGKSKLSLQIACDPLNTHLSYGAQWDGTYGPYSMRWSGYTYKNAFDKWRFIASLGNRLELGDWIIDFTWSNKFGGWFTEDPDDEDEDAPLADVVAKGHTFVPSIVWAPSDKWEFSLKGSYNYCSDDNDYSYTTAGLTASWFPIKDSHSLRIQASAGLQDGNDILNPSFFYGLLGITWNFDLKLW